MVFGVLRWLDPNIRDAVSDWVGLTNIDARQTYGQVRAKIRPDQATAARQAAREFCDRCESLAIERPDDVNTLIGIAYIYRHFPNKECSYEAAIGRALSADPCNAVAMSMGLELDVGVQLATLKYNVSMLDRMIADQKASGIGVLRIAPEDGPIYSLIKSTDKFAWPATVSASYQHGRQAYIIENTDAARAILVERMREGHPVLLSRLDEAAANDVDNAFYDYLKARIFLETKQKDSAVESIQTALGKKRLDNYTAQPRAMAMAILAAEGYPEVCREYVATSSGTGADYVAAYICRDGLDDMIQHCRSRGNLVDAEQLSELLEKVKAHCSAVKGTQ